MTAISKRELQLIEGKKDVRDKYISKVEVLERVKELSLLPYKETSTTEMVAEYYNVPIDTIKSVVKNNFEELLEDGYKKIEGVRLRSLKDLCQIKSRARSIAIFPRRAILRVGMLLRESKVAKEVRTYLLNVEEISTVTQKEIARKSNWTSDEELTILNSVVTSVNNNGTLKEGLEKASELIDKSYSTVAGRWQYKIKKFADKEILDKIKNNKGMYLKKNENVQIQEDTYELEMELSYQVDKVYRENGKLLNENTMLKEENEKLKRMYKKLKNEHTTVMNVVGAAMKHHTNQVLKMDKNRGL